MSNHSTTVFALSIFINSCSIALLISRYINVVNPMIRLLSTLVIIAIGSFPLYLILPINSVVICWSVASILIYIFKTGEIKNLYLLVPWNNNLKSQTRYGKFIKSFSVTNAFLIRIGIQIGIPALILFCIRYFNTPIEIWISPLLSIILMLIVASSAYIVFSKHVKFMLIARVNFAEYIIGACIGIIAMQFVPL